MSTKDPFFLDSKKPIEPCDKNVFTEDSILTQINKSDKKIDNSTNLIGFYKRIIADYLHNATKYKDIEVKTAFNSSKEEDYGNPIVTVRRERLASNNIGIMGSKQKIVDTMPQAIPAFEKSFPDMNMTDSVSYNDLLSLSLTVSVFGQHIAEVEAIAQKIFQILFAMSFDALKETFTFILNVSPPVLGPVSPYKKFDTVYSADISWEVTLKESSILFMKKNLIKYAKILVRENLEENVILNLEREIE